MGITDDRIPGGLDVGTAKPCALVGQIDEEGRPRIIGMGICPSEGMRKGGVVSLEGVARTVKSAKDKAERTSGFEISSALGMHGFRLEVEAHIVTASTTALRNIEKSIESAGVAVDGWVLGSLAAAEVVLTDTEREMGVVVCAIGGGTTDLAIFIEGTVWPNAVIPVGGDHLTNDIAQGLHLPQETAEAVKGRHGHALQAALDPSQSFAVKAF